MRTECGVLERELSNRRLRPVTRRRSLPMDGVFWLEDSLFV